jgi:hypothetical protein
LERFVICFYDAWAWTDSAGFVLLDWIVIGGVYVPHSFVRPPAIMAMMPQTSQTKQFRSQISETASPPHPEGGVFVLKHL